MCGITGTAGLGNQTLIEAMNGLLVHRGPDSEGYHITPDVSLGIRRLKIIDLATGDQPISNEDGSVWTVLNGEIYNYIELRAELIRKGHRFKTKSDTEVLVHLYEEKGEAMLADLRGMYAFAIWSEREKKLLVARDRFGIKPLFYSYSEGKLFFGSEIKCLLKVPSISKDLDPEALADYLSFLYIPEPRSIFRSIQKLPPAHFLTYQTGKLKVERYWDIRNVPQNLISFEGAKEQYYKILMESLTLHLRTDVPWGVFLSGGMDSSSVACLIRSITDQRVHTFSIGFEHPGFNELEYARIAAKALGTEHHEMVLREKDSWILPEMIRYFDEPFADPSAIPTFFVSKLARQHVTVALSGEGSDDTMSGYPWHISAMQAYRAGKSLRKLGASKRSFDPDFVFPEGSGFFPRFRRFMTDAKMDLDAIYFRKLCVASAPRMRSLIKEEILKPLDSSRQFREFQRYFKIESASFSPVRKMLEVDAMRYLPNDLLVKVDRMSMAHSLEVRVPFLDHKLAEFVFSLPDGFKLRGNITKYLLRSVMSRRLPPEILKKPKHGFSLPVDEWMRGIWKKESEALLFGAGAKAQEFLKRDPMKLIWEEHQSGKLNRGLQLWSLLVFETWCRKYQ